MTRERRSIRQVPLPNARQKTPKAEREEEDTVVLYEREEVKMTEDTPRGNRWWLWSLALIFLAFLGFALTSGFRGSVLIVTPKIAEFEVKQELTAGSAPDAKLHYEKLSFSKTGETEIPADTVKKISERASGTIVIYNNFSSAPQRLIKNTRFESPTGRIYRINQSLTVPGQKTEGDKTVPGSIEAQVFADAAGEEYNLALADFTIPGFKSDPKRYAGFFARSKTAISGGFEGTVKTASDAALASARETLKRTLQAALEKEAKAKVPADFVLFEGALAFSYAENAPTERRGSVAVKETVIADAYLFKRSEITSRIARPTASADMPFSIPAIETLRFEWSEKLSPGITDSGIRFTLQGKARAIFEYDAAALRTALLGKRKNELATILSSFPTIEKVDVVLRPFWSGTFSKNSNRVIVKNAGK